MTYNQHNTMVEDRLFQLAPQPRAFFALENK